MMDEFSTAANTVADLLLKADVDWARLFEPYPFFTLFKNFLQVMQCLLVLLQAYFGCSIDLLCQKGQSQHAARIMPLPPPAFLSCMPSPWQWYVNAGPDGVAMGLQ